MDIPYLDVDLRGDNFGEDMMKVFDVIRPSWLKEDIVFKVDISCESWVFTYAKPGTLHLGRNLPPGVYCRKTDMGFCTVEYNCSSFIPDFCKRKTYNILKYTDT